MFITNKDVSFKREIDKQIDYEKLNVQSLINKTSKS